METQTLLQDKMKKQVPDLRPGQIVRVHEKVTEKGKERTQVFEGLVIATKHGKGLDATFTVRKLGVGNVGVERIFPLHMPSIQKIEILRQEHTRRAKLYYVRDKVGKKTKKRKAKIQNLIYDMGYDEEQEGRGSAEDPEESEKKESEEEASTSSEGGSAEGEGEGEGGKEGAQEEIQKEEGDDQDEAPENENKEEVKESTQESDSKEEERDSNSQDKKE